MERIPKPTTAEAAPNIEDIQTQVEILSEELSEYEGKNLTGDTLVEADQLAKQLMEQEVLLRQVQAAAYVERSKLPDVPPDNYGAPVYVVDEAGTQTTAVSSRSRSAGT